MYIEYRKQKVKIQIKLTVIRALVLVFLIMAQLALLAFTIWTTSRISIYLDAALSIVSLFVVLYIVKTRSDPSYKLTWSILILLMPIFGGLFYLLFGLQPSSQSLRRRLAALDTEARPYLKQDAAVLASVSALRPDFERQARYLSETAGFPVYSASDAEHLKSGEAQFERLRIELAKAERFIFLEYFIIEEGLMWNTILGILAEKAAGGVDVKVLYDGIGCLLKLPPDYPATLERLGIACAVFNPASAVPSTILNNRDHRKLVIIDGSVAFTGGVNLADEYINKVEKFGHWKDAAVVITGGAVDSLTIMFINMWNLQTKGSLGYEEFLNQQRPLSDASVFVQPYADSPMDDESVGESVYMNIVNAARSYIYITTPYLIVDHTMMTAICLAAKSGVDVRIIAPRHWDKWYAHMATRSYYDELVAAGVKVYEYVDGFMHAKTFVSDDAVAVIGTTNLDYRSLFLHYECGVLLYGGSAVAGVTEDFLATLKRCDRVTPGEYGPKTIVGRIFLQVLRLLAPLL